METDEPVIHTLGLKERLHAVVEAQQHCKYDDLYSAAWYQQQFPGLPARAFELLEAAGPRTLDEVRATKFNDYRVVDNSHVQAPESCSD